MKIGIDVRTLSYERTGIPVFLHDVLKYWNEWGYTDDIYLYSNRPIQIDFELNNNWKIIIDEKPFGTLWTLYRLPKLMKKDGIEVFWEPMHFLPRRIKGIKYFVTIHDISVFLNRKFGSFTDMIVERLFLKKSCKRADKIMTISNSTKNDLVSVLGVSPEKIQVIYNGDSPYNYKQSNVSANSKKKINEKWNIKAKEYLLFVGTLEPRKNIVTIVRAFEKLRHDEVYNGKLVLAGKQGWKSKKIYNQIDECKYRKDIVVTGYITEEEKEYLYRNAICLLFPSLYEGFGFPILEAMSVGLPVITSDVASMPEVGGDAAYYIDRSQLEDEYFLCQKVEKILSMDEIAYKELGIKGIHRAKYFNRKICAKKIFKELKEC